MNLFTRAINKIQKHGIRYVSAGVLRHIANKLDKKSQVQSSDEVLGHEFLVWIRMAVPGMLVDGNISAMDHAIKNMPQDKPILEIGSFCGLSTLVITQLMEKHSKNNLFFTCDKWEFEGQSLGKPLGNSTSITHDGFRNYVKNLFRHNMKSLSPNRLPHTIECISDNFFEFWFNNEKKADVFEREVELGGEIGFCYIDGNHTYSYVKKDFENTDRLLAPGGFILFDDSADNTGSDVNQLMLEIVSENEYELISRNPNYLFRKK